MSFLRLFDRRDGGRFRRVAGVQVEAALARDRDSGTGAGAGPGRPQKDPGEVVAWVEKYCPDYRNPLTDPWRLVQERAQMSVRERYAPGD